MQNAHTRKTAYTFFCILQLISKENRTDGFQNRTRCFSRNQTELEKFIPHIPRLHVFSISQSVNQMKRCKAVQSNQQLATILMG